MADDLIRRNDALELFKIHNLVTKGEINSLPFVDAVEIKHGKWEPGVPECPVCHKNKFDGLDADIWADWQPAFCPNCGAKMTGDYQYTALTR